MLLHNEGMVTQFQELTATADRRHPMASYRKIPARDQKTQTLPPTSD